MAYENVQQTKGSDGTSTVVVQSSVEGAGPEAVTVRKNTTKQN
jgi:hypothetical protein